MHDAWNPGLESEIPSRLWPQASLFRPENSEVDYPTASELADLTGLDPLEFCAFRPQRLIVHALLVRVTADLSVPDGPNYADLGLNLRHMVDTIYTRYIQPSMDDVLHQYLEMRSCALDFVSGQLDLTNDKKPEHDPGLPVAQSNFSKSLLKFLQFLRPEASLRQADVSSSDDIAAGERVPDSADRLMRFDLQDLTIWRSALAQCSEPLHISCLEALIQFADRVIAHRGSLVLDRHVLINIVLGRVCNVYGARVLAESLEPYWQKAVAREQYRELPAQSQPVVMNVKGASAAGKSTIRPRQRELANKLGIPWEDFAVISPDYWRKYLLDYASLGEDYKYGAMLTGRELEIIDQKLDEYMAAKAANGTISHLLIDRFRFDSFTVDIDRKPDSKLLSRYGSEVYLFFMVTHPANTVERAWVRGQQTGRYKAVDDLLFHNVEAYTGMPALFLSWVNSQDRRVHFEFLDNDVELGKLPRTTAFGWNGSMVILDINLLLNIDRYRRVRVSAKKPEDVFAGQDSDLSVSSSDPEGSRFIEKCARRVADIMFADHSNGQPYAWVRDSALYWVDQRYIELSAQRRVITDVLQRFGQLSEAGLDSDEHRPSPIDIGAERRVTVGQWAEHEQEGSSGRTRAPE